MLLLMRKRIGSVIIKVFAFFVILGFCAWGVQDMLGYQMGGGSGGVAEVGGESLPARALYQDVYSEVNRMRQFLGNSFNIEQAQQLGVIDSVLQRQINAAATRKGAIDLGVAISDRLVRNAIVDQPMFRGLAGNFDRERFQQILQSNGLTEEAYVARLREDLMTQQLMKTVSAGVVAPGRWVDRVHRYQEETRDVETVFVPDAATTHVSEPSDTDLRKYFDDNKQTFTAPEYRALTFVRLDAADLAKETEVAEEDVQTSYDERLDEFTMEERRTVRQMLLSDEAKAKKVISQIQGGKGFLNVAKEIAKQDKATVELGDVSQEDLLPDIADPVFALAKDAVSVPIKSSLGWHVMQVVDVVPGGTKSFEEVRDQVKNDLAFQKAIDAIFDLSNRFEDELGGGASISEAAGRLGLKVEKLAVIDQAGNDARGMTVTNLPGENFLATAFDTEEGEDSAMTEAGEDGFYILHVDGITPPTLRIFDTVRADVTAAWKAVKRREGAQALAAVIVGAVADGRKLADGAAEWRVEVKPVDGVRRRGNRGDVNDELAAKVFKLKPGHAAMERIGEGFRVAALKKVHAAPLGPSESRKEVAEQLIQSLRQDLDSQLVAALREGAGVNINRRAVDALFGERQNPQ